MDLKLKTHLRFFPIYKFMETKNQAFKEFVRENLRLRKIRPSILSAKYLVLFIPKKNGKFWLYIDY